MNGYKIYKSDEIGFEIDPNYTVDYDKAVQIFNDKIRKAVYDCGLDIISREDFSQVVLSAKECIKSNKEIGRESNEIICRTYPVLIGKDEKRLCANVFYWERTSYEYQEYDICSNTILLEEIEIVD